MRRLRALAPVFVCSFYVTPEVQIEKIPASDQSLSWEVGSNRLCDPFIFSYTVVTSICDDVCRTVPLSPSAAMVALVPIPHAASR